MKTVRELIEALQQLDPSAPVALEGSDFMYAWNGETTVYPTGTVELGGGPEMHDDGTPWH